MGAVVAKAVGYIVTAVKGMTALHFVAAATMVAGMSYLKKGLDALQTDEISSLTETSRLAAGARKIIYGKVRVGGQLVFSGSGGNNNENLIQVVALADQARKTNAAPNIAATSLSAIYFNGEKIVQNNNGVYAFTTEGQKYEDHFEFEFFDGSQTSASTLAQNASNDWNYKNRLKGVSYVAMKFIYDQDVFVDGLPNVTFLVYGRKVYDPRTSQNENQPNTWEWSNNPALCLLDYMTDPVYGLGLSYSSFDSASFESVADYCDESVNYITGDGSSGNPTSSVNRYNCDGRINSENKIRANIEDILSSMAGKLSYSNGKYFLNSTEVKTAESTIVDEGMMVGEISLVTKSSRRNQYNTVQGKFASEEANYKEASYPTQKNDFYIYDDGNEQLILDLNLPMTTNNAMAQRIAKYTLNRSRNQTTIKLKLSIEALKFRVGDLINVKYVKFGYNTKGFVIQTLRVVPNAESGMHVEIQALEYDPNDVVYSVSDQIVFQQDLIATQYDPSQVSAVDEINAFFTTVTDEDRNITPKISITLFDDPTPFITHYQLYVYRLPEENATGHEQYIADAYEFTLTRDFGFRKTHLIDIVDRRSGFYRVACQAVNTSGVYSPVVTFDFEIEAKHSKIIAPNVDPSVVVIQQTSPIVEGAEPTDAEVADAKGSEPEENDTVIVQQVDNTGTVLDAVTMVWTQGIDLIRRDDYATNGAFMGYADELFIDIWCIATATSGGTWSKLLVDNSITANTQSLHDRSTQTLYTTNTHFNALKGQYVDFHPNRPVHIGSSGVVQKLVYTDAEINNWININNRADKVIAMFRFKLQNTYLVDNFRDAAVSTYKFQYDPQISGSAGYIRQTHNQTLNLRNFI